MDQPTSVLVDSVYCTGVQIIPKTRFSKKATAHAKLTAKMTGCCGWLPWCCYATKGHLGGCLLAVVTQSVFDIQGARIEMYEK